MATKPSSSDPARLRADQLEVKNQIMTFQLRKMMKKYSKNMATIFKILLREEQNRSS